MFYTERTDWVIWLKQSIIIRFTLVIWPCRPAKSRSLRGYIVTCRVSVAVLIWPDHIIQLYPRWIIAQLFSNEFYKLYFIVTRPTGFFPQCKLWLIFSMALKQTRQRYHMSIATWYVHNSYSKQFSTSRYMRNGNVPFVKAICVSHNTRTTLSTTKCFIKDLMCYRHGSALYVRMWIVTSAGWKSQDTNGLCKQFREQVCNPRCRDPCSSACIYSFQVRHVIKRAFLRERNWLHGPNGCVLSLKSIQSVYSTNIYIIYVLGRF